MKRYIFALCIVLSGVFLYTSCLGSSNDSEVIVYDDMAITGFSLSAVNRYIHTTSKKGTDSIYKKTLTSALPTFTIEQYPDAQNQYKIYNTDSLPKDCDLKHVLATISTSTYSGSIAIKSANSDTLYNYSSTDSLDFSTIREIRVYNNTLQKYRAYQVSVNKHQVDTDKILWEQLAAEDLTEQQIPGIKCPICKKGIPVSIQQLLYAEVIQCPICGTNFIIDKWFEEVVLNGLDGWLGDKVSDAGLKTFIGAGTKEAYALSQDGQLMVSTDGGDTWAPDNIDDDPAMLPTNNIAFVSVPFAANDSTDYQLMVGTTPNYTNGCVVWRKIAEYASGSAPSKWVLLPVENYNIYTLPWMEHINLLSYNGLILAIGNDGQIYQSRDQGITWKATSAYTLPEGLTSNDLSAWADDEYIWIMGNDTGEVWRGIKIE